MDSTKPNQDTADSAGAAAAAAASTKLTIADLAKPNINTTLPFASIITKPTPIFAAATAAGWRPAAAGLVGASDWAAAAAWHRPSAPGSPPLDVEGPDSPVDSDSPPESPVSPPRSPHSDTGLDLSRK